MNIKLQNTIITVINIILAIILFVILARPGQKKGVIEVKLATIEDISSLPFWVAYDLGFFDKYGVKFKPNEVSRPLDEYENTLKGALYASFGIDYSYALFKSAGDLQFLRVLYYATSSGDGIVVKDTSVKFNNLNGKRIGYYDNTRYNVFLQAVLSSKGDTLVDLIGLTIGEIESALDNNRVDAIYVVEPYLSYMKEKGYKVIAENVIFSKDVPIILGMGISSAVNLSLRKEAINRIRDALKDAIDYIDKNPQEARNILKRHLGLDLNLPNYKLPSDDSDFRKFTDYLIKKNFIAYKSVNMENIVSEK